MIELSLRDPAEKDRRTRVDHSLWLYLELGKVVQERPVRMIHRVHIVLAYTIDEFGDVAIVCDAEGGHLVCAA